MRTACLPTVSTLYPMSGEGEGWVPLGHTHLQSGHTHPPPFDILTSPRKGPGIRDTPRKDMVPWYPPLWTGRQVIWRYAMYACENITFSQAVNIRQLVQSGFPLFQTDKIPWYFHDFSRFFSKFPGIFSLFLKYDFQVVLNINANLLSFIWTKN